MNRRQCLRVMFQDVSACLSRRRQHRQRSCRQVLHHWRYICTVRALQQQGRAAAHSLQLLRLKQAWQLWRRAHRAALAARQRQYSKMVYELLTVSDTGRAIFLGMLAVECKLVCDVAMACAEPQRCASQKVLGIT